MEELDLKSALGKGIEPLSEQVSSEMVRFDTGIYALNRIISGSYFLGIRSDKITAIIGLPDSGKSFLLCNIVRGAQQIGYVPIIFDSERAVEKDYYERIGIDIKKAFRIPVTFAEQLRFLVFDKVKSIKEKYPDLKLFIGLDSVGNLTSKKELADAEKDSGAGDMGQRAKSINSAMRIINHVVTQYDIPFVFTNHVYPNPSNIYSKPEQSGGLKAQYNPHVILYVDHLALQDTSPIPKGQGFTMKVTTVKNRDVPEGQVAKIDVSYQAGILKYSGLVEDAQKYGFLVSVSQQVHEFRDAEGKVLKSVRGKTNLYTEEQNDVWKAILPDLDKKVRADNSYSIFSEEELRKLDGGTGNQSAA